jgi:hypothetical protein
MLLTVTEMEYVKGYRLRLTFNNGVVKEIDLSAHWEHLFGSVFQPLRDPDMFAQVFLSSESETIELLYETINPRRWPGVYCLCVQIDFMMVAASSPWLRFNLPALRKPESERREPVSGDLRRPAVRRA